MVLIINLIIGVLFFNLIGGCVAFLVWKVTSRAAMKFYQVKLVTKLLLISLLAFVIPLSFGIYVARCYAKYASAIGEWYVFEIIRSKLFLGVASVLIAAWLAGCVSQIIKIRKVHNALWQSKRIGEPLSEACQRVFEEEKQRLHLKCRIVIQKNRMINSSHVFFDKGVHVIQIPAVELEEEEFRVVCRHELYHVKNNDYRTQRIIEWISAANWYNFFLRRILKDTNMWVDICRDMEVIQHGDVTAKRYYDHMADVLVKQLEMKSNLPYGMTFAAPNRLIYRMNVVTEYFEKERKHSLLQGIAVVLLFSFLFVFAVGSEEAAFREGFLFLYRASKRSIVEVNTYVPSEEYCEPYSAGKTQLMTGEVLKNGLIQFNLTMTDKTRFESEEIYLEKGQELSFVGYVGSGSFECKYGYTDGGNDYFSIESGTLLHGFCVPESGDYRFFVEGVSGMEEETAVELAVTIHEAE